MKLGDGQLEYYIWFVVFLDTIGIDVFSEVEIDEEDKEES